MNIPLNVKKGIALPATRGSGGYFAVRSGEDLAWGGLVFTLMTPIGSRPMRRDWGSGLSALMFEEARSINGALQLTVRDTAARWCPDVIITGVSATARGSTAGLSVNFVLASSAGIPAGNPQPVQAGYRV